MLLLIVSLTQSKDVNSKNFVQYIYIKIVLGVSPQKKKRKKKPVRLKFLNTNRQHSSYIAAGKLNKKLTIDKHISFF